jgi:hypothetical protein
VGATCFFRGTPMDIIEDYFLCDKCENKNFIRIYNFSVQFRRVNFSDDLLYDEVTGEIFQCTHCKRTFSRRQIEEKLKEMVDERLKSSAVPQK